MEVTDSWRKKVVDKRIRIINENYTNPLMSIEPTYDIKEQSKKEDFIKKYSSLNVSSNFKVKSFSYEELSIEDSLFLFTYNLTSGVIFKKEQTVQIIQKTKEPLDRSEILEKTLDQTNNFDLSLSFARWISKDSVEILSFSEKAGLVLWVCNYYILEGE